MRKDVVFCNAVCKAEEVNMLSTEALLRLSAADFDEAVKMLHDYGYNEGVFTESSFDIDRFISRQTELLIAFIKEYSCSDELEEFLLAPYIVNNVKAEYKRRLSGVGSKLYDVGVGDVCGGDYSEVNKIISDALVELDGKKPNASDVDRCLTEAMYKYRLYLARKSRSKLLIDYAKSEIDIVNILSSLRMLRLAKSDELFIKGGFTDSPVTSKEQLPKRYEEFDLSDLIKLETQGDNYLLRLASSSSENMDSFGPILSYVQRKSSELKTVKMILVCLKSDARSDIPSRLRGIW